MMSFRGTRLQAVKLPLSIVWLLETLAESKGRQQLYERQSPQLIKSLREMALIESAESSNRIEGVTVKRNRLRPLVIGNTRPRDRSEEEIVGYRMALNWIHTDCHKISITPEICLRLHAAWPRAVQAAMPGSGKRLRMISSRYSPTGEDRFVSDLLPPTRSQEQWRSCACRIGIPLISCGSLRFWHQPALYWISSVSARFVMATDVSPGC